MIELHFTKNTDVYEKLNKLLYARLNFPFEILRTANGKPYIEGNPLFFSISHSMDMALIAICDKPVGADIEFIREKKYNKVLSSFSTEEREEIKTCTDFLKHWVVREGYIKMLGSTLASKLKDLKFVDNVLYDNEKEVECEIMQGLHESCVYCICIDKQTRGLI